MSEQKAYLVVNQGYEGYDVERVYLDREEAEAFVDAYNATSAGYLEVEEAALGAPSVEYDGPVWIGEWLTHRKLRGERQLIVVSDGFTTVMPSAVPTEGGYTSGRYAYREFFAAPNLLPPDYEEPPVWIDSFYYRQEWQTGDSPSLARVVTRDAHQVVVRGTSKDAVEALLRDIATRVKAERGLS